MSFSFHFSAFCLLLLFMNRVYGNVAPSQKKNRSGPRIVLEETEDKKTDEAVKLDFVYIGDIAYNLSGGIKEGGTYAGLAALGALTDMEKAFGWKGVETFLHLQGLHGTEPSNYTGDAQIASNVEAYTDTVRMMEAWIRQEISDYRFTFLIGLLDLNAEFNLTKTSFLFLNSSFGLGAEIAQVHSSGRTASTFPFTSLAALFQFEPNQNTYIDFAVFDALPVSSGKESGTHITYDPSGEGHLLIGEVGYRSKSRGEFTNGYSIGAWGYDVPLEHINSIDANGSPKFTRSYGFYTIGEQKITDRLWVFLRYGMASEAPNRFKDNISTGLVLSGPFSSREDDELGFGFTTVTNSEGYIAKKRREATKADLSETAIELTYRFAVSKEISLQPDLQYIINPNTDPSLEDALAVFLRIQIDLGQ